MNGPEVMDVARDAIVTLLIVSAPLMLVGLVVGVAISLLQALTNAGGFTRDAKRDKVRILRPILNTSRRAEIDIDTNEIYSGKANDFPLLPNDVLYVPRSYKRVVLTTFGQILLTSGPYIIFTLVR